MKSTTARRLLISSAFLALASVNAFANPVSCQDSSLTGANATLSNFVGLGSSGCQSGDFVFSNFLFEFSGDNTPSASSGVLVTIDTYTTGYTDANGTDASVSNPLSAVIVDYSSSLGGNSSTQISVDQSQTLQVQYTVSLASGAPGNAFVSGVDGSAMAGLDDTNGDASGDYLKDLCSSGGFQNTGTVQSPTLTGTCAGGTDTSVADQSFFDAGQPVNTPGNWDTEVGSASSLNMTSFGVHDEIDLSGGDVSTGAATAAAGTTENDLIETFQGAPEPGTFVLFGGALVALGVIRRKKIA